MEEEITLNAQGIRDVLMSEYGYTEEKVNEIKGIANLRDALKSEMADFNDIEEVETQVQAAPTEESDVPEYGDLGWHDYVMSLFEEDDLYDGMYPTLKGLRRVAVKILGRPVSSRIVQMESTLNEESPGRAYCVYELAFNSRDSFETIYYQGAADAYPGNIQGGYNVYPVAIAENRAEARAYRKALLLNIVTAEEMGGSEKESFVSIASGEYKEDELMSATQMKVIESKARQLNICKTKFLESQGYEEGKTTKKQGKDYMAVINGYQQDMDSIPAEIKL